MVIVEMKKHFNARIMEWWSASLAVIWGAYALTHPGMFDRNPAFHAMLLIAPQHMWGLITMTIGMVRMMALTINGFYHRTPLARLITSIMCVFVWFWVTTGLVLSRVPNPGVVVYFWHLLGDMYSAFRCASDTYEAEAQKRLRQLQAKDTAVVGGVSNVRSINRK